MPSWTTISVYPTLLRETEALESPSHNKKQNPNYRIINHKLCNPLKSNFILLTGIYLIYSWYMALKAKKSNILCISAQHQAGIALSRFFLTRAVLGKSVAESSALQRHFPHWAQGTLVQPGWTTALLQLWWAKTKKPKTIKGVPA